MRKAEIKVGGHYLAKVAGKVVTVRVDSIKMDGFGKRLVTTYQVTNLATGRKTMFRSAAKFRGEVPPPKPHTTGLSIGPLGGLTTEPATEGEQCSDPQQPSGDTATATVSSAEGLSSELEERQSSVKPTTRSVVTTAEKCDSADSSLGDEQRPDPSTNAPVPPANGVGGKLGGNGIAARIAALRGTRTPGTPVAGMIPNAEQEAILAAAVEPGLRALVVGAGAGCLAGDTIIHINRCGKGFPLPIRDLVARQSGEQPIITRTYRMGAKTVTSTQRNHPWDLANPTCVARADGSVIRLCNLANVWYSGDKQTFTLTTISGRSIRATAIHPFLTETGKWLQLQNLKPGDALQVNSGRSAKGRGGKPRYHQTFTRYHPHQVSRSNSRCRTSVATHRLLIEAQMNDLTFREYVWNLCHNENEAARFQYLREDQFVHHINNNTLDNSLSNLKVVDGQKGHSNEHEWEKNVLWQVGLDTVDSIEPYGIEPTYDIEVADNPHNFIANGFVVHNTGKTATLKMLEQVLPGKGQYTAFNSSLVAEGKAKFVKAACNTTHSLAFRAVGKLYQHRLGGERMRSQQVAHILGIEPFSVVLKGQGPPDDNGKPTDKVKVLQADFLAGQVLTTIRRFCQSADRNIIAQHLRYIDGIDVPESRENNDRVQGYLLPFCRKAWADLSQVNGQLPFSHDCYVKIWSLGEGNDRPIIAADYILLDEAQDTAPVFLDVLKQQQHALLVFVGDSNQCQPIGTMVTVVKHYRRGNRFTGVIPTTYEQVPIESIQAGDVVASYNITNSFFRRSGCTVKETSVRPFNGELVVASTSGETSAYTPNHKCVARVGDALNDKWVLYLMRKGNSFRIGKVKGMYETQRGAIGLTMRMHSEHADAAWVLDTYDTEEECLFDEATTAWAWGIPSLRFHEGTGRGMSQADLDAFWRAMGDLTQKADTLLKACRRDINYPFCIPARSLYRNRGQVMHACNLMDGMLLLSMKGALAADGKRATRNKWSEIEVSYQYYNGNVYSLNVDGDETYVADGIITHNSIYEWRGAVDAMKAYPDATRRLLTQSYRFGQAIADVANVVLATLEDPTDLVMRGNPAVASRVEEVANPRCYLYRTNAGAVGRVMAAIGEGKKPHLIGGGADVVAWCQAAMDLQAKRGTRHPELCCFESWGEVVEYSKTDEGSDLKLMVKLIEEFGAESIRNALRDMPKEEDADLVVSTAHRSKGREWDTVKLGQDFPLANKMTDADCRLLYVAATRAKLTLDITECPPFCGGEDKWCEGGSGARWVPGIKVTYTQPIPVKEITPVEIQTPKPMASAPPKQVEKETPVTACTYTKLRNGDWGLRSTTPIKEGDTVTVTTKAGQRKVEVVGRVLWSGNGVWFATKGGNGNAGRQHSSRSSSRGQRTGCSCGSIEGEYHDWYCSSCRHDELDM